MALSSLSTPSSLLCLCCYEEPRHRGRQILSAECRRPGGASDQGTSPRWTQSFAIAHKSDEAVGARSLSFGSRGSRKLVGAHPSQESVRIGSSLSRGDTWQCTSLSSLAESPTKKDYMWRRGRSRRKVMVHGMLVPQNGSSDLGQQSSSAGVVAGGDSEATSSSSDSRRAYASSLVADSSSVSLGEEVSSSQGSESLRETEASGAEESEANTVKIPLNELNRRTVQVSFTCNRCGGRSSRLVNPLALAKGTVFVQCEHCEVYHQLVDNLNQITEYNYLKEAELERQYEASPNGSATSGGDLEADS